MQQSVSASIRGVIICAVITFIAQYAIGKQEIDVGFSKIPILPMVFGVLLGLAVSVNYVRSLPVWNKIFDDPTESFCAKMIGYSLLVLGTQYAGMIVPNIDLLLNVGIPLLVQEVGNLLPIFVAIPIALKLGFGRKAIGACSSISREPSVAVMQNRYKEGSQEYIGVLAIYLCGSVFGVLWFSIVGSLAPMIGLHPLALGAGCGVGSGSMLSACAGSLVANMEEGLAQEVLGISAASNLLSSAFGAITLTYVGVPLSEWVYKLCTGGKK